MSNLRLTSSRGRPTQMCTVHDVYSLHVTRSHTSTRKRVCGSMEKGMLTRAIQTLSILGVFTAVSKAVTPWNEEQRWVSEMLDPTRYDVATRPVKNVTDAVEVTVEIIVIAILRLDSKNQELLASTSSNMGWEDKRLRWNPSEYSGMESIIVKANMVWYPNVVILNSMDGTRVIPSDTEVLITSEGELFVSVAHVHNTQCFLKQKLFPFDTQVCTILLGTRGAPSDVISLTALQHIQNTELIRETANWELKDVTLAEWYSPVCIKHGALVSCRRSSLVSTYVCLKRVSEYYVYTVMFPITILTLMASFVFWLPPGCGEKLSFSVSVFFGFVIFQLVLLDGLAEAGDNTPSILMRYVLITFTLTGVAVVVSAITLILQNRSDDPEMRDPDNKVEPLRNGNELQNDNEVTSQGFQLTKSVPRNWKKIAVYVDRISFVLFWIAYTALLIVVITELRDDAGCPDYD